MVVNTWSKDWSLYGHYVATCHFPNNFKFGMRKPEYYHSHNDLYSAAQTVLTGWVHTLTHLEGGPWS